MSVNCDPSALANAARCWTSCIPGSLLHSTKTYLLCRLAVTGISGGGGSPVGALTGFSFAYSAGTSGGTTAVASWDAPPAGVTGTEVWVSTDGVTYILLTTVAAPATSTAPFFLPLEGIDYAKARWVNASNQGAFGTIKFLTYRVGDWAARIIVNGGVAISQSQMDKTNDFVKTLIDHSLYSRMLSMIVPAMGKVISGTTTLFKVIGGTVWINHNFVDADFSVDGGQGNGVNEYVDTTITPADVCNALGGGNFPAFGVSLYENDALQVNNSSFGSRTAPASFDTVALSQRFGDGNSYWACPFAGVAQISGGAPGWGLFIGSRTSPVAQQLYLYNSGGLTTIATGAANVAGQVPSVIPMYAWDINDGGLPGVFVNRRFSYLAVHDGFNAADALTYGQDVQAFLTALGSTVI